MDNLTTTPHAGEICLSVQELHVYRHVDSEKLQSKALVTRKTHAWSGNGARACFAKTVAVHEKAYLFANLSFLGGALWIA
jgi:hypothetical protein